jgi:hypothetical protein
MGFMRTALLVFGCTLVVTLSAHAAEPNVTFTKDVAPIFQQKCERCHRTGGMAPMPLSTFEQARPWARSIKAKVQSRDMPPWHVDRRVGIRKFKNDMSLTDAQIATIVAWADAGAPKGSAADMPPPLTFPPPDAWSIGKPDLVVSIDKENTVPADGYDRFAYHIVATTLTEDRWVKAYQIRPGHAAVVHHACVAVRPSADAPPGPPLLSAEEGGGWFGCYDPGFEEVNLGEDGAGQLLKKGTELLFELHYHPSGTEVRDRTSIGFVFYPRNEVPKHSAVSLYFESPAADVDIPANTKTTVEAWRVLRRNARITSYTPHMHMRGSGQVLEAILPNSRVITLSAVDRYNFLWQTVYTYADDVAPLLPAGTVLHLKSIIDNTAANPRNPDPQNWVGYGQSSQEEMPSTFVGVIFMDDDEFKRQVDERARKAAAPAERTSQQP